MRQAHLERPAYANFSIDRTFIYIYVHTDSSGETESVSFYFTPVYTSEKKLSIENDSTGDRDTLRSQRLVCSGLFFERYVYFAKQRTRQESDAQRSNFVSD